MKAVIKHELNTYFKSLTAYVFGAFLLAFVGIGAMLYNIQASVSNFEYVLSFCSMVFVVIVPILTMKTLADEKRQKTDQLLYSLPISTTEVVVGKFLSLLVVFLIPMAIIAIYPLIFARFGDVYLPTAYGSMAAFFIMGAGLIALGIFISSLTDNQGFAAGIGIAIILLNYFSVSLSEYVSSTTLGSLIAIAVVIVLIGLIVATVTKDKFIGYCTAMVLGIATIVTYMIDKTKFEGILPNVMSKLSFFERFTEFVNGVFDWTSIVFYCSAIALFLFLAVQVLEKRRYN